MVKKTELKKRIVLLDAHAIIHRAYHALPDFSSSNGTPTGALYGVSTMLLRIATEFKPEYIVACYDLPKPTFRHIVYAEYKAGRQKADSTLVEQLNTSREIFEAFSVPIYEYPGFEADDILGTIVEQLKDDETIEIIIASGDMDTMQLIDGEKVKVYTLKKGINDTILYNEQAVVDRFGFTPLQIPDYKGLAGDNSDNIIGIKGIGTKTATTLITEFGSIENIYKALKKNKGELKNGLNVSGITPRMTNLIVEGEESAIFSKTLATIRRDAPISYELSKDDWIDTVDMEKVKKAFTKFEFKSLLNKVQSLKDIYAGTAPSFTFGDKKTTATKKTETNSRIADAVLASPIDFIDAQVCLWLLNADKTNPSLESMFEISGADNFTDAHKTLKSRVMADKKLSSIYTQIEEPLMPIVAQMKEVGVTLDSKYLETLTKEYSKELGRLEKKIHELAGREFNISSPKQLGVVLFEELKLEAKGLKKTSTGARSTNIDTLNKLEGTHPIIPLIMEYREYDKMLSTYLLALPKLIASDGKIHSTFIQTGAATGRFSSLDPNMQNLPVTLEEGKNVRRAFVVSKEKTFLAFDYSQIDLRCATILSNDNALSEVFKKGEDVHSAVAMKVFNVEKEQITQDMRRSAKAINFGIVYGMGVSALRENIGGERKDAQEFYDAYKESYSTLMAYLERVKQNARRDGYTETLFGRRRPMPLLKSSLPFIRAQGERMAINAPIQGTTADIMRLALVDVHKALKASGLELRAKLILQIHDEIILEVDEDSAQQVIEIVKSAMEDVLNEHKDMIVLEATFVPLLVSVKKGQTLGDLKSI